MPGFSDRLLSWWQCNGRKDLPWQQNPTPYRVWISEIMLQQTQVATVIPYYLRFIAAYPDGRTLADANLDDVLHHWSGLGYYARARNLHKAAQVIRDEYDGRFPESFDEVVALHGIGRSTAGAILALSRGERHAILDGNVKRVLARFHALEGWPGSSAVANSLWEYAEQHTPRTKVAAYTQAVMDLGATVCTRSNPRCDACPLSADCKAHALGRETDFPGRRKKKEKPRKTTLMLLVQNGKAVYLERRPESGIWGGLYSLPEISSLDALGAWCAQYLAAAPVHVEQRGVLRHSFSHYDLDIHPVVVRVDAAADRVKDGDDGIWYEPGSPPAVGVAAPVAQLIRDHGAER